MSGDNLYKRGAVWWCRFQSGGAEHRRSLRTSDRKEAVKRLEQIKRDVTAATHFGENRLNWKAAVVRYLTEVGPQAVKPSTLERYTVSLRQCGPYLEALYIDQIARKSIADLISARRKTGATNATINRDLTAVSAVIGAAVEWGACETNPARDFNRRLTRERRDPINPPARPDVEAVIARCPGRFASMVRFLDGTGCRQEEAAGLTWPQINLKAGTVTFTKTKTSRPRTIRIEPGIQQMLASLPRFLGSDVVFWREDGERYLNVSARFGVLVRSAQESAQKIGTAFRPFRCHDLRHGFAVRALENGWDIYALSRHLGHSSVKTTEIYLGYVPGAVGTKPGTDITVSRGR
jgi:integrase